MRFCSAPLGVWFNGQQRLFLRKIEKGGKVLFEEIPNIPQHGQRLEDIGLFKKKDLKSTHNLKEIFKSIRNYLAGNAVGTTRDEELAKQLINVILCKLYDEKFTKPDDIVHFRAGVSESLEDISSRIKKRFSQAKEVYKDVLEESDSIDMDDKSIAVVVGELQNYGLLQTERDALGDAFEIFIGRALKGGQGQFFTPRNVVKTVIEIIDPKIEDRIIDPACGSGGFLVECLRHIHKKIENRGAEYNWPETEIEAEKVAKINNNLRGIEKDKFLSKVAKAYMVILGDGKSGIFCQDSLDIPENWEEKTQASIQLGSFDIVITNPPFGAKIQVRGTEKLSQFPLGYKWEKNKKDDWVKGKVKDSESPQILFIDRCFDLLREGGRLGIVLPDGTLRNPTDGYIRQSLLERTEIIGLIDLPMSTFLPYTPTKTHLLFLRKKRKPAKDYEIFMSYAKTCGHDKRGRQVNEDEIRLIPEHLKKVETNSDYSHLGFKIRFSNIKDGILLPKYYNPDLEKDILEYRKSGKFKITTIADLVQQKIIKIMRGNEVGSENYGTGDIPFIRTSEVANWELIADCTQCLSEDIYNEYKNRQKIQEEDILVVNDGTYLMGRTGDDY